MPGVIMETADRHGSHTNHDRDRRFNGVNGETYISEKGQDKAAQGRNEPQQNMTPISPTIPNGINGNFKNGPTRQQDTMDDDPIPEDVRDMIDNLPPEIIHITAGFVPLSELINRVAQTSYTKLRKKILELAQMPLPPSTMNGNASQVTRDEDNSNDNVNKKMVLLDFATDMHTDWIKVLVILIWSRRAPDVSKIIDLRAHLLEKQVLYDEVLLSQMFRLKKGLTGARLRNPDLKTAVEVLSTGKANWMPDLGYIAPPLLTPKELLKSLEKLNTLLSIRLNLHDYEKIPLQFKDYIIKSGRVTFRVAGEFEVDLTIADEDPESQFWFIDFRFLFSPALSELPPRHHTHVESRVNAALMKDGLSGCYTYLHEMVLTHKISEFRSQAAELSRNRWIDGLKIEPLHRALCIQYWLDRYTKNGPRSWIILGVHSGRRKDGYHDPKATSYLFLRWFRDSKEVKDVEIPIDTVNISAEKLLKSVIALHTNHILGSTHSKLLSKPIFANRDAALSLSLSADEPKESELKVQLTDKQHLSVTIEPIMGRFIFSPASRLISTSELKLNERSKDPANEAFSYIENLRCVSIAEEIYSLSTSVGWQKVPSPRLSNEDLKPVIPKDTLQLSWFRRPGWREDWLVAVSLSMSGETWWLIELSKQPLNGAMKISSYVRIPLSGVSLTPTYTYMSSLHVFVGGLLSHYTNLRTLHQRRVQHQVRSTGLPSPVRLPSIYIQLFDLFPCKAKGPAGRGWAQRVLKLTFQGLEPVTVLKPALPPSENQPTRISTGRPAIAPQVEQRAVLVAEARIASPIQALMALDEKIDDDIAFHAKTGAFAFRLRSQVGESIIPALVERLAQVERVINFSVVIQKHKEVLKGSAISLEEISFSYGTSPQSRPENTAPRLYRAVVDLTQAEGHMKLALENGNPHVRVLDALNKVLNSAKGLDGVANLLPQTLHPLRAFDAIEQSWSSLFGKGEVFVFVRAFEWFNLRYILRSSKPGIPPRRIAFDVKMNHRRGDPWWFIRRTDKGDKREPPLDDEIDGELRALWESSGPDWRGMRTSAVACGSGIELCLLKLDEVIRNFSLDDLPPLQSHPPPSTPSRIPGQNVGQSIQGQQLHQQQGRQLQLPTPAHSQSHSQSQPHSQGSSQGNGQGLGLGHQQRMPTPNMMLNSPMTHNQNNLKRKPSNQAVNPRGSKRGDNVEID